MEKKVVDRAGNTGYDVGLWKFMAHLERVVPIWMGKKTAEEEERRPRKRKSAWLENMFHANDDRVGDTSWTMDANDPERGR